MYVKNKQNSTFHKNSTSQLKLQSMTADSTL